MEEEEEEEVEVEASPSSLSSPSSMHAEGSLIKTSPRLAPETQRRASPLEAPSAKTATRSRGAEPPRASSQEARSSAVEEGEEEEEKEEEAAAEATAAEGVEVEEVEKLTIGRRRHDKDGGGNLLRIARRA